ncbi:hypothetical protein ACFOY2_19345 [Nonomuraea purpurea]|uniref:Uncharacterized protein n=1 Tax=Nonomuraea purpurea TaxID=1849276 RepID=A0ABV8G9N3_9ACTN
MSDDDLVESIRDELTNVGLPVLGPEGSHGGVQIEVDEGVWVSWKPGRKLTAAGMAALRRGAYRGDERHPSLEYRGTAIEAMNDAIAAILNAAGFDVREGTDEYHHPMELLVESRRTVPHWRDPIAAPLDGASGFMPGVRVRVLAGELAGTELVVATAKVNLRTSELVGYQLRRPGGDGVIDVTPGNVELAGDEEFG